MNDLELVEEIKKRYPIYQTPIFSPSFENPNSLDFVNGPCAIIDESGNDYKIQADEMISNTTPINTRRAYTGDLIYWSSWFMVSVFSKNPHLKEANEDIILQFILEHLVEMPKDVEDELIRLRIKKYRGPHSLATIKRRLTVLSAQYKAAGAHWNPCNTPRINKLLNSVAKNSSQKKNKAITKGILENLLQTCEGGGLIDIRDKALLLFAFSSGGRRRSEISDAMVHDLETDSEGNFVYRLPKSKTDQEGKGNEVPLKGKAAKALKIWLDSSKIAEGKIFRSIKKGGRSIGNNITSVDINRIVKKRCEMAGYDPTLYSAHSLRSGFVTEAGKQGCPIGDVMQMTTHTNVNTVMKYYRAGNIINNKAADLL
jgi:integrase